MIVSFHPHLPGDFNLRLNSTTFKAPGKVEFLRQARGVILPQSCKAEHYWSCKQYCSHVFPNYDWRYGFEGKCGNARLFSRFGASQPASRCYETVAQFGSRVLALDNNGHSLWPAVLKPDRGGGGYLVRLVRGPDDLDRVLRQLSKLEQKGQYGFMVQEYRETESRDLRVVVIGDRFYSYWRCQPNPQEFRTNLGRGGRIVMNGWPEQQGLGSELVRTFCHQTGLNLAAFDLIFPVDSGEREALFLEINYCFGRKGVGGTDRFRRLLLGAVGRWQRML